MAAETRLITILDRPIMMVNMTTTITRVPTMILPMVGPRMILTMLMTADADDDENVGSPIPRHKICALETKSSRTIPNCHRLFETP